MSVSLTNAPLQFPLFNAATGPGACLPWCIQEDSLELIPATRAEFQITVTGAAISGSLQIAGKTFTVNNLITDYNSSQFNADSGDAIQTATNLMNAVKSNIDIYPYWNFSLTPSGSNYIFKMTAKNLGYIAPTPFNSGSTGFSSSFTQGTPLLLSEGYKYGYQLIMVRPDLSEHECTQIQTVKPRYDLNAGETSPMCFNLQRIASNFLKSTFPSLSPNTYQWDSNAIRKFYLRYGYVDRIGCNTLESGFRNDYPIYVVNHSAGIHEKEGPLEYAPDPFAGPAQFKKLMTSRSKVKNALCRSSYAWVYGYFNGVVGTGDVHLAVRYNYHRCSGGALYFPENINDPMEEATGGYDTFNGGSNGVFILPIGGANKPGGYPAGVERVTIKIGKLVDGTTFTQLYEDYVLYIDDNGCTCNEVEMYFSCRAGGYDTIVFDKFAEVSLTTQQESTTFRDFCRDFQNNLGNWRQYLAETGTDQYQTIAKRRFKVTTKRFPNDEAHKRFIEEFISSEHRMVRVHYTNDFLAQKINIIHSDFITEKELGFARYELTFELAHSLAPVTSI